MKRPDPIDEPSYNWPTGRTPPEARPAEKALAALKVGALLAGAVTIAFIYLGTYAGIEGRRDFVSALVLAAFVTPSLVAWLLARRRERRRRGGREGG
jgi:hypothetical protein